MARIAKFGLLMALIVGAEYVSNHTSRAILQIASRVVMVRAFFFSLSLVGNILFGDDSILSISAAMRIAGEAPDKCTVGASVHRIAQR